MHHAVSSLAGVLGSLYLARSISVTARKTGTDNAWFAFVPILNVILRVQIADNPWGWLLLLSSLSSTSSSAC